MPQFRVKIKNNFSIKGTQFEKGMEVEMLSKQTSVPNLLSAGKQEIVGAFQRKYGVELVHQYISSNYLEVVKL